MPIPDEIPQGSQQFVAIEFGSSDDLTLGTVHIGFSTDPVTMPTSWLASRWPTSGVNVAETVSPVDTTVMEKGHYQVWGRITDSPEILPRVYGTVRIV